MARIVFSAMVATLIVIAMTLSFGLYEVRGQPCQGNTSALMAQCGPYVQKDSSLKEPSQGCCGVIKQTDIQCVCEHLAPSVGASIDMDKAFYVCKECGKPLKPGSKCGSGNGLTDEASTT